MPDTPPDQAAPLAEVIAFPTSLRWRLLAARSHEESLEHALEIVHQIECTQYEERCSFCRMADH